MPKPENVIRDALHPSHVERHAVRVGSQFADARRRQGRTPFDDAADRPLRPRDLRDQRFGDTVLQRHDDALFAQERQQFFHHLAVVQLLGHQEDHVVDAFHLVREDRLHRDGHVDRSADVRALFAQGFHVRLISVHQFHRHAGFRHVSTQHRAERAGAVDRIFHHIHLSLSEICLRRGHFRAVWNSPASAFGT